MDQQQFKVKFSLRTKLLLSIAVLLLVIIAFLNFSTIFILKEDKRAYVYQAQATETTLAGRDFVNTVRHSLDTLRVVLGAVDPSKPISPQNFESIKTLVDNQSEISSVTLQSANILAGTSAVWTKYAKEKDVQELQLTPEDAALDGERLKNILPELLKNSYALLNTSRAGVSPTVGIALADLKLKDNPAGLPIIFAVVSIKELASALNGKLITLANKSGATLYDTDAASFFSKKQIGTDPLYQFAVQNPLDNGATEFDDQGTHYLGSFLRPGYDLVVLSKVDYKNAMSSVYSMIEKFIFLGSMSLAFAVIFALIFSKTLTAQLLRLFDGTKEVAAGNFDLQLEVGSYDEIGALTDSFNVMSKRISDLLQESVAKVRLENELSIASTVQQTLFPASETVDPAFLIRSHYQSASECGGDWWGYFQSQEKLCLMIADATGHGLPSALITAAARSCFSVIGKLAQEDPDFSFSPAAMLSYANRVVYDASLGKIMMTFFVATIDFAAGTITYSSAGHNPPWLFKKEGDSFALKSLVAVGTRLGETAELAEIEEKSMSVSPGDILFLYTDGLMEGKDLNGDQYGKKRTRKVVEAALSGGPDKVVKNIMEDFLKYNEGKALDDDITIAATLIIKGANA